MPFRGLKGRKKGMLVNYETIIPLILCNYFDISMDYMLGTSKNNNYVITNKKLNKELIGKRLKTFRKTHNLVQEILTQEINTSHSTISAYENGRIMLLTAFAYDIAKKYNISLDWLCGRIDYNPFD